MQGGREGEDGGAKEDQLIPEPHSAITTHTQRERERERGSDQMYQIELFEVAKQRLIAQIMMKVTMKLQWNVWRAVQ